MAPSDVGIPPAHFHVICAYILYGENVYLFLCTISNLYVFRILSDRSSLVHAKEPDALNHSFVATATCTTLPSVSLIHSALLLRLSNHSARRSFLALSCNHPPVAG